MIVMTKPIPLYRKFVYAYTYTCMYTYTCT